ncbi:unnamed protein product [Phaedon cochleariae]|uniref:C2H2-type domain-containing protein n=1 Tax=Phaedon cochleariae TaxID=80249 RepID=A0A9N9X0V6_PHACE|nr:unnamed protein product [Phaedon cochleariae]
MWSASYLNFVSSLNRGLDSNLTSLTMTKICRLCLQKLQRGSKYFNINAVESYTGFMPYRDQLTTCIPEMALDLVPNPVICNNCRTALKYAYDFKTRCLLVEKKIQEYIESLPDQKNYDLSQLDNSFLLPFDKIPMLLKGLEQDLSEVKDGPSGPLKKETEVQTMSEYNEGTIDSFPNLRTRGPKRRPIHAANLVVKTEDGKDFICGKCDLTFPDMFQLLSHKSEAHADEFVCNFCEQSFKSLQNLRKHNNVCSRRSQPEQPSSIITKRPHLPAKAKNHLKRWLFRHTEHPYPTDHEKQMLMQETHLSLLQVENWFINARRRILQDLTKLKRRGVKSRKKSRHNVSPVDDPVLGMELELEEILLPLSPPAAPEQLDPLGDVDDRPSTSPHDSFNDSVNDSFSDSVNDSVNDTVNVKKEPEIQEEQLDLGSLKCEAVEDR